MRVVPTTLSAPHLMKRGGGPGGQRELGAGRCCGQWAGRARGCRPGQVAGPSAATPSCRQWRTRAGWTERAAGRHRGGGVLFAWRATGARAQRAIGAHFAMATCAREGPDSRSQQAYCRLCTRAAASSRGRGRAQRPTPGETRRTDSDRYRGNASRTACSLPHYPKPVQNLSRCRAWSRRGLWAEISTDRPRLDRRAPDQGVDRANRTPMAALAIRAIGGSATRTQPWACAQPARWWWGEGGAQGSGESGAQAPRVGCSSTTVKLTRSPSTLSASKRSALPVGLR